MEGIPQSEVAAWEIERNEVEVSINWQFTTDDVRVKSHRVYPTVKKDDDLSLNGWKRTQLQSFVRGRS